MTGELRTQSALFVEKQFIEGLGSFSEAVEGHSVGKLATASFVEKNVRA